MNWDDIRCLMLSGRVSTRYLISESLYRGIYLKINIVALRLGGGFDK